MKKYAILLVFILSVFMGCDGDEVGGINEPEHIPPILPPTTPSMVMARFQTIHEEKNFDWYRDLIHPDFLLLLGEETVRAFPDLGPTLDREADLMSTARMFSGDDLTDPNGSFVPGIIDISFGKFQPELDWSAVPPGSDIPGDLWAPYNIEILFNRGQRSSLLASKGTLEFYVAGRDSVLDGVPIRVYQLSGIRDLTAVQAKAVEEAQWGTVRALYRPSPEN